jgi:hypothetical protein
MALIVSYNLMAMDAMDIDTPGMNRKRKIELEEREETFRWQDEPPTLAILFDRVKHMEFMLDSVKEQSEQKNQYIALLNEYVNHIQTIKSFNDSYVPDKTIYNNLSKDIDVLFNNIATLNRETKIIKLVKNNEQKSE